MRTGKIAPTDKSDSPTGLPSECAWEVWGGSRGRANKHRNRVKVEIGVITCYVGYVF